MDILRYQIEELEAAQLRVGEQAELTEKTGRNPQQRTHSARRRRSGGSAARRRGYERRGDGRDRRADALEQAAPMRRRFPIWPQRVRDAEFALSDAAADVSDYLDSASSTCPHSTKWRSGWR